MESHKSADPILVRVVRRVLTGDGRRERILVYSAAESLGGTAGGACDGVVCPGVLLGRGPVSPPATPRWAEVFAALHRAGRPGAFANGGLSLVPGAAFVAAHPVWSGPAVVLTLLGWVLVVKGTVCFLAPGVALRGMGRAGAGRGREFAAGGVMLLAVAGVLAYVLWTG